MKPHCINLALVQSLSFIANHPMKLCFGIVAENQKIFLLKILVAQIKPQKRKNEGEITKWVNLNLVCCPIKNEWIRTCRITSTPKKKKKPEKKWIFKVGLPHLGLFSPQIQMHHACSTKSLPDETEALRSWNLGYVSFCD